MDRTTGEQMRVRLKLEYHPEYGGEFEPYVAFVLDYPGLMGYGQTRDTAIQDALEFLEEHLGKRLTIVQEEVELELAS
jgi:predicted RNase H-like HicB family nuclease